MANVITRTESEPTRGSDGEPREEIRSLIDDHWEDIIEV